MSSGTTGTMDPGVARRRDELYGATRTKAVTTLKESLTQDHIKMIAKEAMRSTSPILHSTTKFAFKGSQPDRSKGVIWDSGMQKIIQNRSHFELRGDSAPVDEGIYKASLSAADYNSKRKAEKLPSMKQVDKINLPDMNPRYWRDDSFGQSLYNSDFVGGNTIRDLDNNTAVPQSRNEMRRRNVNDLRTTHFRFGNDPSNFDSETADSYHKNVSTTGVRLAPLGAPSPTQVPAAGAVRGKTETTPAVLAKQMIEDERDSAVFRHGDYNVTRPRPGKTTFTHDFDARLKPDKSAAFVEPTRIPKGRFLQDDPVLRMQLEEEGTCLLPPIPRDEEAIAKVEATSSALKQIFLQYDPSRVGCVSKDVLRRVVDCLLDPIPEVDLDRLITRTQHGKDGTIDYEDFVYNFAAWRTGETAVRTMEQGQGEATSPQAMDITPGVLSRGTGKSAGTAQGGPMLDNANRGKEYQTSVHFEFGNDHDPAGSIYNKDFTTERPPVVKPTREEPPKPSEVMHKIPGVGFESSTKQNDYMDFGGAKSTTHQDMLNRRDLESLRNKRRHNVNNVILTCDRDRDTADRQHSLSHTSYVKHAGDLPRETYEIPQSKYRYLDSVGCLPYAANIPATSETREAYDARTNMLQSAETQAKQQEVRAEKRERVDDARRVHFMFGNDALKHVTEAQDCFTDENHNGSSQAQPAAGKRNNDDPKYRHTQISQNTQDLTLDPMRPSIYEQIRLTKKTYYNNTPNPSDPLHMTLRRTLMAADPERTGKLTKAQMRELCSEFQINVSQKAMNRILDRCSNTGDGRVDYHQFVRNLTLEQVPQEISAAHSTSTMRNDFKPLQQRSHTDAQLLTIKHMESKPVAPAQSHFFHADPNFDSPFASISNRDFCKPELQGL